MRYFDLHCDTLCACFEQNKKLYNNNLHVDLQYKDLFECYVQCTAAFVHDNYTGQVAFDRAVNCFEQIGNTPVMKTAKDLENAKKNGGVLFVPTIENGNALAGKLENIDEFKAMNVKMITLTWNADNQIGGGIMGQNTGLTEFGKSVVSKMNELNIVTDISHASESLFEDVCKYSQKAIVASHSNAKQICKAKRNLSNEQIKEIIRRKGLIGINFYEHFLTDKGECTSDDILKHIEYFLSLGAENVLAMGSDFDGASLPKDMKGLSSIPNLYEKMHKLNYSKALIDKIFFDNAFDFFQNAFTL